MAVTTWFKREQNWLVAVKMCWMSLNFKEKFVHSDKLFFLYIGLRSWQLWQNGLHFIKFITLKRCDSVATATKKKKSTVKKNLVIVESPAKAKTIEKYLGRNYKVLASVGHIRDLKKSSMSVDIENNYEPQYINNRARLIWTWSTPNKLVVSWTAW